VAAGTLRSVRSGSRNQASTATSVRALRAERQEREDPSRAPDLTSPREGKLVNISTHQVVQLLESQGNHDRAQQASQQLPGQFDTDNGQHADLLSKLDSRSLSNQLGGLRKLH
jgi:hypothetical protein